MLVYKAIDRLPSQLGMKKLKRASVIWADGNNLKDPGGWSGYVIIAESHISIHTFPKIGFASIDVYTCKNELDKDFVMGWFRNIFEFEDFEDNLLIRGKRFPFNRLKN